MLFIFKKQKVVVDCFTKQAYVHEYAPIQRAAKFLPQWWWDLPKAKREGDNLNPSINMRYCAGFTDLYAQGLIMPMWSDFTVRINADRSIDCQYSDGQSRVEFHPDWQRGAFAPASMYTHLKLLTPWMLKSKQNINWHMSAPIFSYLNPDTFVVCPGVVNFKHLHFTNANILVANTAPRTFDIEHGTPLLHLIPLTDKALVFNNVLVDDKEYDVLQQKNTRISFIASYYKAKKIQNGKCPFHRRAGLD